MNKEFIPYEESLVLKELGFDEPCISKWEENYLCQDEQFDICNDDTWLTNSKLYHNKYCSAPTYSQAFRWFRENHGLCAWVYQSNNGRYHYAILKDDRYLSDDKNIRTTYQESELESLRKLIHILRNK